jgi:hypothetical protein
MFYCTTQQRLIIAIIIKQSRGSSGSTVFDCGLDDLGSVPDRSRGFFFKPLRPDRLWGPPSLLSNGYQGRPLPGGKERPGRDADHCSSNPEPKRHKARGSNPGSAIHQRKYYNLSCYFTILAIVLFHLARKDFTKKGSSRFRTPAGAINLTVAGFKTFFLTLKFSRTEKYQVTHSCLGETWENQAQVHMGRGLRFFNPPLPLRQFGFALVEGRRGTWKLWSGGTLQNPTVVGPQKQNRVDVSSRAVEIIT